MNNLLSYKVAYNVTIVSPILLLLIGFILNFTLVNCIVLIGIFIIIMGCIPKEKGKANGPNDI